MEALIRKRNTALVKVTKIESELNIFNTATRDIDFVKELLLGLEVPASNYQSAHEKIINEIEETHKSESSEKIQEIIDEQEEICAEFESILRKVRAKVKRIIKEMAQSTNENDSNSNGSHHSQIVRSSALPPIKIETFDGSYEKWIQYKAMFNAAISSYGELTTMQKFHYLRSSLGPDPLKVIGLLDFVAENYEKAWERLEERYSNKRLIVDSHLKGVMGLKKMSQESSNEIYRILDESNNHIGDLKTLGMPTEHWDVMLIHIIASKLDDSTRMAWENSASSSEVNKWSEFTEFLQKRCRVLEAIEHNDGKKRHEKKAEKISRSYATTVSSKCYLCQESHRIFECEKFLNMNVKERYEQVQKYKLCGKCLRFGHYKNNCQSKNCCKICKRSEHNSLLCNQQSIEQNTDKRDENSKTKQSLAMQNSEEKQVILATALINIYNGFGEPFPCRVVLDSCSEVNMITESFANKLKLKKENVNVKVSGVSSEVKVKYQVNAFITSCLSKYEQNIECLVMSKFINNVPTSDLKNINVPAMISNTLADPQFSKSNEVDMLIGAEHFYEIMKSGNIRFNQHSPIFQETVFGWIVGGRVIEKFERSSKTVTCNSTTRKLNEKIRSQDIKYGTMVIVKEDSLPMLKWKVGRVTQVDRESQENQLVTIKTTVGSFQKSIQDLHILPKELE